MVWMQLHIPTRTPQSVEVPVLVLVHVLALVRFISGCPTETFPDEWLLLVVAPLVWGCTVDYTVLYIQRLSVLYGQLD
jgi:hypothetical protein